MENEFDHLIRQCRTKVDETNESWSIFSVEDDIDPKTYSYAPTKSLEKGALIEITISPKTQIRVKQ